MKKLLIFGAFLLALGILTNCGADDKDINAKDIKISDLDTPCDYVEAVITCMEECIDIKGDKESSELTEDEREEYIEISTKGKAIEQEMQKKYTLEEAEECASFEKAKKLGKQVSVYP